MAYDVFISHSSADAATAGAVCAGLERAGLRCWMAPRDIRGGESWAGAILRGIDASRLMVLVLSARANQSEQVMREVGRAVDKGLAVLPFRIENVRPGGDLEYHLSRLQWLDATTPPLEAHVAVLAETALYLLGRGAPPAPRAGGGSAKPFRPVSTTEFDKRPGLLGRIQRLLDPPGE